MAEHCTAWSPQGCAQLDPGEAGSQGGHDGGAPDSWVSCTRLRHSLLADVQPQDIPTLLKDHLHVTSLSLRAVPSGIQSCPFMSVQFMVHRVCVGSQCAGERAQEAQ